MKIKNKLVKQAIELHPDLKVLINIAKANDEYTQINMASAFIAGYMKGKRK